MPSFQICIILEHLACHCVVNVLTVIINLDWDVKPHYSFVHGL